MTTTNIASHNRYHLPDGKVSLLGGVSNVTPTCQLVELGAQRLLIDCGIDFNGTLPPKALDAQAVILTHAHFDHVGGLPQLLAQGRIDHLYATTPTIEIARTLLCDSIRLNGGSSDDCYQFVKALEKVTHAVPLGTPFTLPGSYITVSLHEAGHILGSCSVELRSANTRLICSGDLGRPDSPILRDYNTKWSADRPVDLVLLESTYAGRIHKRSTADLEQQLLTIIKRALTDGGHILVPSFAIGRTQVLLYLLNNLVESGQLPPLPVAVDTPMGLRVTETYQKFKRLYDKATLEQIANGDQPLDFENLYAVRRAQDSRRLDEIDQSMLIIAGSGMCTGGRMLGHMAELLHKPETNVVFVGYQAAHTPGAALQEFAQNRRPGEVGTVHFGNEAVNVRAQIDTLHGISAHADQAELAGWLRAIPNVEQVGLYHGERDGQVKFMEQLNRM